MLIRKLGLAFSISLSFRLELANVDNTSDFTTALFLKEVPVVVHCNEVDPLLRAASSPGVAFV